MDDDLRRARAFHDPSGAGPFLWRPRPRKERLINPGPVPRHRRAGHHPLVGRGLFACFFTWVAVFRRIEIRVSSRCRCATEWRLFLLGLAKCLRHVSAYVRNHYAGIDHRRDRGADEICGGARFRRGLDVRGLLPNRTHGLGNRWLDEWCMESGSENHCHRFRRRDGSAHVLRLVGACSLHPAWAPDRIQKRSDGASQHGALHGWDRLALGGLVRLQRRKRSLATAVASFTWAMLEYLLRGKPSVLGFCSGAVGGLVVITPACGYVDPTGAIIIGVAAGIVPFFACTKLKSWLGYDDALDTFGIHAVGGTLGAFLTGVLATASVNPNLSSSIAAPLNAATQNGLAKIVGHTLWLEQLKAIAVTIVLAVVGSAIIGAIVRGLIGLRIAPEIERQGLDINQHGEEGYMTS